MIDPASRRGLESYTEVVPSHIVHEGIGMHDVHSQNVFRRDATEAEMRMYIHTMGLVVSDDRAPYASSSVQMNRHSRPPLNTAAMTRQTSSLRTVALSASSPPHLLLQAPPASSAV